MKTTKLFLTLLLLPLIGYSQSAVKPDTDLLCQTWVFDDSGIDAILYESIRNFKKDEGGMQFFTDGTLVMRTNAGWCATPPITYKNYPGNWEAISETEILVEHEFWGGTIKSIYTIKRLTKKQLLLKVELDEVIRSD